MLRSRDCILDQGDGQGSRCTVRNLGQSAEVVCKPICAWGCVSTSHASATQLKKKTTSDSMYNGIFFLVRYYCRACSQVGEWQDRRKTEVKSFCESVNCALSSVVLTSLGQRKSTRRSLRIQQTSYPGVYNCPKPEPAQGTCHQHLESKHTNFGHSHRKSRGNRR